MIKLSPYLNFNGNARAAMEFYQSIFGGVLEMNTYEEFHMSEDGSESDKIMHAMLTTDNGMILMASDVPEEMGYEPGKRISLSVHGDEEVPMREYWEKLSVGGSVGMQLEKAPWGDFYGMLTDQFGIEWSVNISA